MNHKKIFTKSFLVNDSGNVIVNKWLFDYSLPIYKAISLMSKDGYKIKKLETTKLYWECNIYGNSNVR